MDNAGQVYIAKEKGEDNFKFKMDIYGTTIDAEIQAATKIGDRLGVKTTTD